MTYIWVFRSTVWLQHLNTDDNRNFSMATPNTIVKGILWIYGSKGNAPSSSQIIADYEKALNEFGKVYEAGGKMVHELVNQSGHRNHAAGRNTDGWGGVRVKNVLIDDIGWWLHRDALEVKSKRIVELIRTLKFQGNDDALDCTRKPQKNIWFILVPPNIAIRYI